MSYKFLEKDNNRYRNLIEAELYGGPNPFPRNPVSSRDNLPKFCLGRDEEIGIIKNGIEKVSMSYNHKSVWIPINGSGGTGKTTIALYVYDSSKNKTSRDLDIDFLESAYIESPSNSSFLNLMVFYRKILADLGNPSGNFPYQLGFEFIIKLCSFFANDEMIKEDFERNFSSTWNEIRVCSKHSELMLSIKRKAPRFIEELKEFVKEYDFLLLENEDLKLPIDYILLLIDLVSPTSTYRIDAYNQVMGEKLEMEDKAIEMLENLISVINFLSDKTCLLLILDNLENLPLTPDSCQNLFRVLLKFRNTINNCLLLTIGSTDFWNYFRKTLNYSELNMLDGFKYEEISLMSLSERDASRIMNRYLYEFWNREECQYKPSGADSKFPFSMSSFQYLYEIKERNLRDSLKKLYRLIEKYKINSQIYYLKKTEDAIYHLRPKLENVYLFENELNFLTEYLAEEANRNILSRNIKMELFADAFPM